MEMMCRESSSGGDPLHLTQPLYVAGNQGPRDEYKNDDQLHVADHRFRGVLMNM
jgi:hypothetical protein